MDWRWVRSIGRLADLYVFARHPVFDLDQVDHRAPEQWVFHVVPEHCLPQTQRTIGLAWLQRASSPVEHAALGPAVMQATRPLAHLKREQAAERPT